jgi:hypothetical protein
MLACPSVLRPDLLLVAVDPTAGDDVIDAPRHNCRNILEARRAQRRIPKRKPTAKGTWLQRLFDQAPFIVREGPWWLLRDVAILRVKHPPGKDHLILIAVYVTLFSEACVTLVVRELRVAMRTNGALYTRVQGYRPRLMKASIVGV